MERKEIMEIMAASLLTFMPGVGLQRLENFPSNLMNIAIYLLKRFARK